MELNGIAAAAAPSVLVSMIFNVCGQDKEVEVVGKRGEKRGEKR